MTDKSKPTEIKDADLEDVQGGFYEPGDLNTLRSRKAGQGTLSPASETGVKEKKGKGITAPDSHV